MGLLTLRGMAWTRSFRIKTIRNIDFLAFHILCKFWSFYALRTLSPCCLLGSDEASCYGAPHAPRKDMYALISFKNNPKHRLPWFSRFVRVLLVLRSEDLFTLLFTSFRRGLILWCSSRSEDWHGGVRFV